jgi:anti-anti-sigma factor
MEALMVISSRTPEGRPNHCSVCGSDLKIDPSDPVGDAPCPVCGHLLWFTQEDRDGDRTIKFADNMLRPESLDGLIDSVSLWDGSRLVLDFKEVLYLSSSALGKLISLKKQVGAMRRQLVFRHVHPDLLEVFRVTRLDQVFEVEL